MSDLVPPPFLFTYWNPFSKDSSLVENWFSYVKNVSLARYTADSVGRYMEQVSVEQINAIHSTGHKICGVIYNGMSELQNQLHQVEGQLDQVQGELLGVNQRLGLLLDEAKTSNILQQNIAELLRIPDSQRQRQHHIELGLKFLKNALMDEDLYQDALHELLEAEKLMHADYFVLHRIGLIYLYSPALGNLEKALDYFVRAAKYAVVESHPEAARLNNILNKSVNTRFDQQDSSGNVSELAAESYQEAGTALYAMGRYEEACNMAEKAVKCQPKSGKYHFFLAKYQARLDKTDSAVQQLQNAIELSPEMALATVGDFDLNRSRSVLDLLETLDKSINSQLNDGIKRLEKWKEENKRAVETDVLQWINRTQESLQADSYSQKRALLRSVVFYEDILNIRLEKSLKIVASLNEAFIGQERIKFRLAKALEADNNYDRTPNGQRQLAALGHILLLGPAGMGKGALAAALVKSADEPFASIEVTEKSGPYYLTFSKNVSSVGWLLADRIDIRLQQEDLREDMQTLLKASKDFTCEYSNGRIGKTMRFTLVGTALSIDQLPSDWLSVFSIIEKFDPYSEDERIPILEHIRKNLGIDPNLAAKCMDLRRCESPGAIYDALLPISKQGERLRKIKCPRCKKSIFLTIEDYIEGTNLCSNCQTQDSRFSPTCSETPVNPESLHDESEPIKKGIGFILLLGVIIALLVLIAHSINQG